VEQLTAPTGPNPPTTVQVSGDGVHRWQQQQWPPYPPIPRPSHSQPFCPLVNSTGGGVPPQQQQQQHQWPQHPIPRPSQPSCPVNSTSSSVPPQQQHQQQQWPQHPIPRPSQPFCPSVNSTGSGVPPQQQHQQQQWPPHPPIPRPSQPSQPSCPAVRYDELYHQPQQPSTSHVSITVPHAGALANPANHPWFAGAVPRSMTR